MQVKEQFNRYAKQYQERSIIQQKGAQLLVDALPKSLGSVIDLGCGNGRVFKLLQQNSFHFEKFYGVDFSESMLSLHPKGKNIKLFLGDFNSKETFIKLQSLNANTLLSASALQWAKDIKFTFAQAAKTAPFGAFFLFSSGTFKTIHKIAGANSPIHSYATLEAAFLQSYQAKRVEKFSFKLPFSSTLEMLRYIQKSGVSGKLMLPYRALKKVLREYPYNYLEFETALFIGESYDFS